MILVIEPLLKTFLPRIIYTVSDLINEIKKELEKADQPLERIIYLRKYTGKGLIKGILDYIDPNTLILPVGAIKNLDFSQIDNFIIGPLNMEELDSYYQFIFQNNVSVYPIVHPILASKFYKNLMFYPWIPKHAYIPENSLHLISNFDFDQYFDNLHITNVIFKDEYGFHTGQMVPYELIKVGDVNKKIQEYVGYASRVEDFGGILIEEFIGNKISTIYKTHIFGKIIPQESIKYTVYLRGLEGTFKSYNPAKADLLEKVDSEPFDTDQKILGKLNPLVKKFLPYLFASLDYVLDSEGNPVVIDVNSIAGSLGEIQAMLESNNHNPFEFFYTNCQSYSQTEYKNQKEYFDNLKEQYQKLKILEGIFNVNSKGITKLNNKP